MNIEINKWYRLRGGKKAYVSDYYTNPFWTGWKYIGYVDGQAVVQSWDAEGNYLSAEGEHSLDIVDEWSDCKHCWHPTGRMLTSLPPKIEYICCNCGETKSIRSDTLDIKKGHGPFCPRL